MTEVADHQKRLRRLKIGMICSGVASMCWLIVASLDMHTHVDKAQRVVMLVFAIVASLASAAGALGNYLGYRKLRRGENAG